MTATITGYGIGLFIHVLAVVLTFGPTFAFGIFVGVAQRSSPRSVPTVLRGIQATMRFLIGPGLIVILLAGIYMLIDHHIGVGESWVSVGIAAIVILFGMTHGFFRPNTAKALELAERDLAAGDTLSPEFEALSARIATAGRISGLIVAVTIFFMTVQP